MIVDGRKRDLPGGLSVLRVLPAARCRMVGPFVFLDHMGPADRGVDIAPHPHIGLATVTYLFEGEVVHRDSLGSHQVIRPGAVNWMTAGRGIVHSERAGAPGRLHGLQLWVALPSEHEQIEPAFDHYAADVLPELEVHGARVRVLAGAGWGVTSPVRALSPLIYADLELASGELPVPSDAEERAVYVVSGTVRCGDRTVEAGQLLVLEPGADVTLRGPARAVLVGGAPVGERLISWNFVSSSPERLEQARRDWRQRRFPSVPGDDGYIPLPE